MKKFLLVLLAITAHGFSTTSNAESRVTVNRKKAKRVPAAKLSPPISLPNLDVKDPGPLSGRSSGKISSGSSSTGTSNGTGSSNPSSTTTAGANGLQINDAAKQAKLPTEKKTPAEKPSNPPAKPGPTGKGGKDASVPFDKFYPVCLFVDPMVPNANQMIKDLVDMAAKCAINLVVYPKYLQAGFPRTPSILNSLAKSKCNATEGLKTLGVNRASVATLLSDSSSAADMCKASGSQDIVACAEFGFDPGDNQKILTANLGRFGGVSGQGSAAAAILGGEGLTAAKLSGAVLGQGLLGKPPGVSYGNETGNDFSEAMTAPESGSKKGWSSDACSDMRSKAFQNPNRRFRWDPNKTDYLSSDKTGKSAYNLAGGIPIFGIQKGGPGGGAKPAMAKASTSTPKSLSSTKGTKVNTTPPPAPPSSPPSAPAPPEPLGVAHRESNTPPKSTDPITAFELEGPKVSSEPSSNTESVSPVAKKDSKKSEAQESDADTEAYERAAKAEILGIAQEAASADGDDTPIGGSTSASTPYDPGTVSVNPSEGGVSGGNNSQSGATTNRRSGLKNKGMQEDFFSLRGGAEAPGSKKRRTVKEK